MAISNMRTTSPVNTFFGPGSSRMAGKIVSDLRISKVLLVCDQGVRSFGLADPAMESLQAEHIEVVVFDRVQPDPPAAMVDELAAFCKRENCQCIVAVGGGSVLDTSKSVAILQTNPGSIRDYAADREKPRVKGIPLIAIPTTAGTGSEVTNGAVITMPDSGKKEGMIGPDLFASFALIDPLLTLGLPKTGTANTAMDAFSHSVESMLSGIGNPICDILSLEAIRLISENLELAIADGTNVEARQNLMLAAHLAGMSLNDGACNFGHAIAHAAGAKYHIPHGAICALTIPMTLEYFADVFPEKIGKIAGAMRIQLDDCTNHAMRAEKVANAVRTLNSRVGIKTLKELGIPYDELPALTETIMCDDSCLLVLRMTVPDKEITASDFLIPLQKEYART